MNLKPVKPDQQQKHFTRWIYHQHSQDFVGWVNKLGIERTWIGRIAHYLDNRFHLQRVALFFIFSLALSFFISWDVDVSFTGYKEGDLAAQDIKSPMTYEFIDIDQTQRKKMEAEEAVPPVYDF